MIPLSSSLCHRSPPAVPATRVEPPPLRGWRLLCLPWLLALLCFLALQFAAQASASPAPVRTGAALGVGPASLTVLDPVDRLAIDLAEHLPGAGASQAIPPLPLHTPWATASLGADEAQGGELPAMLDRAAPLPQPRALPAPLTSAPFTSSDPRRSKRPPRPSDRERP